jgi:DNA-binding beta-propeller fold protein YncE
LKLKRHLLILAVLLILIGVLTTQGVAAADILYIGDGGDNTVKRFDAESGAFLDADANPANDPDAFVRSESGGLSGPTGLLFDGNLLVANQNVNLKIPGEILRYDGQTGAFQGALISSTEKDTPFAPRGIVLSSSIYVADLISTGGRATGRLRTYDIDGNLLGDLDPKGFPNNDFHPRGVVFGPDGFLYVSVRDMKKDGLGGHVLRFKADGSFDKVFIADKGGVGQLNRPEGLVFGPDGNLYITSFRANEKDDTDSVRIYSAEGQFLNKIDLYIAGVQSRAFAQAILFGPEGCLFVPINNTGEVRRYDVGVGTCGASSPYDSFVSIDGPLKEPWYLTFGKTDPETLEYRD